MMITQGECGPKGVLDIAVETPSKLSDAEEDFLKEQASLLPSLNTSLNIPLLSVILISTLMACCNGLFTSINRGALSLYGALVHASKQRGISCHTIYILHRR